MLLELFQQIQQILPLKLLNSTRGKYERDDRIESWYFNGREIVEGFHVADNQDVTLR